MRTLAGRRLPRTSTALLAALLVFSSMSLANDTTAEATTAFSPRVNETLNGGMITIGNAVIECDPAQDASGNCIKSHTAQGFQNDLPMKHTRVDARFSTNSSTSDLRLPAGATVRHAYLYWTGTTVTAGIDRVKWAPPGATALETLSPTATVNSASPYVYVADVTAQVRAAGDGTYVVGDIVTTTGNQQTAGWVLAVVYEAPGEALRNVSLFDGFVDVSPNTSPEVSISGFKTPPIGDVHSSVTVVALSLIHISEPTRLKTRSRMPSSA